MTKRCPFRYFKTSPEIIRLAVMLYIRFPLSLRTVEDLLHERGIDICHETVRFWWHRFGPMFAAEIRKRACFGTTLLYKSMAYGSEKVRRQSRSLRHFNTLSRGFCKRSAKRCPQSFPRCASDAPGSCWKGGQETGQSAVLRSTGPVTCEVLLRPHRNMTPYRRITLLYSRL